MADEEPGRPEPDEPTGEHPGPRDDAAESQAQPPGGSPGQPRPVEPGATQEHPAARPAPEQPGTPGAGWTGPDEGATAVRPGLDDATQFHPPLPPPSDPYIDDTQVTPAANDPYYNSGYPTRPGDYPTSGYSDAPTERWSGRAGVPPAGGQQWAEEEQEPEQRRSVVLPVLFAVVLVALLALLGFGIWLALRDKNPQSPSPEVTATATSSPTASPTPTTSPTPSPTAPSSPASVGLPNLAGVSYTDAVAVLKSKGLAAARVDQVSSDVPEGTVISTDPKGPTTVPGGSTVTLYVAVPPATSAPPSPTASPSH